MLSRIWKPRGQEQQLVDQAIGRLRGTREQVAQLEETVLTWLGGELPHDWFVDAYRVWLTGFSGVDGEMWNADRSDARRLLNELDDALRRALAVRRAIVGLIAEGHAITAPPAAKRRHYEQALASPLGAALHYGSPMPPMP